MTEGKAARSVGSKHKIARRFAALRMWSNRTVPHGAKLARRYVADRLVLSIS